MNNHNGVKIVELSFRIQLYCFEDQRSQRINQSNKLISLAAHRFTRNEVIKIIFKETWSAGEKLGSPRRLYYNDVDYFHMRPQYENVKPARPHYNAFLEIANTELTVKNAISGYKIFCPEMMKTFFIHRYDLNTLMEKYG